MKPLQLRTLTHEFVGLKKLHPSIRTSEQPCAAVPSWIKSPDCCETSKRQFLITMSSPERYNAIACGWPNVHPTYRWELTFPPPVRTMSTRCPVPTVVLWRRVMFSIENEVLPAEAVILKRLVLAVTCVKREP